MRGILNARAALGGRRYVFVAVSKSVGFQRDVHSKIARLLLNTTHDIRRIRCLASFDVSRCGTFMCTRHRFKCLPQTVIKTIFETANLLGTALLIRLLKRTSHASANAVSLVTARGVRDRLFWGIVLEQSCDQSYCGTRGRLVRHPRLYGYPTFGSK